MAAPDLAGLANVAYRCLAGVPPTDLDALEENRDGPPSAARLRVHVPRRVGAVLAKALSRPPGWISVRRRDGEGVPARSGEDCRASRSEIRCGAPPYSF